MSVKLKLMDISEISLSAKDEIANYIKEDTLEQVNQLLKPVNPKISFYTKYGKRFLDIIFGTIGVILGLPFNIIIAAITYFDVGCPIIFKQQRIGLNGKKFTLYKFRNMTNEVDANGELLPAKQRLTRWGKFVRKTSLDELLNFISIVKGDMSIIGPRPLVDYYLERLNNRHRAIYLVKPGLECPTLKRAGYSLSWQERLDNYVWYVENCSLRIDICLCFRVLQTALNRKSTSIRANAQQGSIMGYDFDGKIIYSKEVPEKYVERFCNVHGYACLEEAIEERKKP